ncbi:uncharacterized protein [Drosophila bipectinata]|uniref:uncharacterized protein isoform X5 n=1 Tax=Drosophila bipectinata TaxID=42026 RepID=UPI0038B28ECA
MRTRETSKGQSSDDVSRRVSGRTKGSRAGAGAGVDKNEAERELCRAKSASPPRAALNSKRCLDIDE